jgi:hypothetical protein
MKSLKAVLAICAAIAAAPAITAEAARNATEAEIAAIRTALVKELVDPESAQFRDVKVAADKAVTVCGLVNAKNRAGGYVGYHRFIGFLRIAEGKPPTASIVGIDGPTRPGSVAEGMCRDRGLI